jgi:hypothetical protein
MVEVLTDKQVAKRKSEMFKRISSKKLNALLAEDTNKESVFGLFNQNDGAFNKSSTSMQPKIEESPLKRSALTCNGTFLLVDIRLEGEYDAYHIKEGRFTSDQLPLLPHQPGPIHRRNSAIRELTRKSAPKSSSSSTTRMTSPGSSMPTSCCRRASRTSFTSRAASKTSVPNSQKA